MASPANRMPWEAPRVPLGFWEEEANVKKYLVWLGRKVNLDPSSPESLYALKSEDFANNRGMCVQLPIFCTNFKRGLLLKHGGSVSSLLTSLYPHHNWQPWRFHKTPAKYWSDPNNRLTYMKWLSEKMNVSCDKDWFRITKEDIVASVCLSTLSTNITGWRTAVEAL